MTRNEIKAIVDSLPQPIDPALPNLEEAQAVPVLAYIFGIDEQEAAHILAMERGDSQGDVEEVT